MIDPKNLLQHLDYIRPSTDFVVAVDRGVCDACGGYGPYIFSEIINDSLAKEWDFDNNERKAFSSRESMYCVYCGCTYRLRALARAIKIYNNEANVSLSLEQIIRQGKLDGLKIAEINSCGVLHDILRFKKGLVYSEYEPVQPNIVHQDLMKLTYASSSFDIVLTSDTFEHIADPKKALEEIWRILKPGGAHIFTVPVTMDRETRRRAHLDKEKNIINDEEPSFHGSGEPDYLVWNEFGYDFIYLLEQIGFSVVVYFQNPLNLKDPSGVFIAVKPKGKKDKPRTTIHIEADFGSKQSITRAKELLSKTGLINQKEVANNTQTAIIDDLRLNKIRQLYEKYLLTQRHADNLSDINNAYAGEIKKLNAHILELQKHLELASQKVTSRVYNKIWPTNEK